MYRNWKRFDSESFIKLLQPCFKFDVASGIDEAWDSVLPLKLKTFTKHQCPFFDDELLRLKRKKRNAERKFRKSKSSVLKSEYENVTHMYFIKFLEKRRLYIENALMEKCSRKKFATLKLLLGQDVEQLPKYENKKQLANDFNEFFISKVGKYYCIDSHCDGSTSPRDIIPTHLVKSFPDYYFLNLLKLLNFSLKVGCFPQSFEMAIVKPHLKKANSDHEHFSIFRTTSNLSSIWKVLERAAFMQMREHLEKNNLFSKYQSAYSKFLVQKQPSLR